MTSDTEPILIYRVMNKDLEPIGTISTYDPMHLFLALYVVCRNTYAADGTCSLCPWIPRNADAMLASHAEYILGDYFGRPAPLNEAVREALPEIIDILDSFVYGSVADRIILQENIQHRDRTYDASQRIFLKHEQETKPPNENFGEMCATMVQHFEQRLLPEDNDDGHN